MMSEPQTDPPQQTTPPTNEPTPQQPQRPQVNVHTDNTPILDAVNSLPDKLGDVVKELFEAVKPPQQPEPQPQQQQPLTPQPQPQPQQPTPQQPASSKPGRVASWFFGMNK